jgi:hypothetical protein
MGIGKGDHHKHMPILPMTHHPSSEIDPVIFGNFEYFPATRTMRGIDRVPMSKASGYS